MGPQGAGHWVCCGLITARSELEVLPFSGVPQNNGVQLLLARRGNLWGAGSDWAPCPRD